MIKEEFDEILGKTKDKDKYGCFGLYNLGNSCYMNSSL